MKLQIGNGLNKYSGNDIRYEQKFLLFAIVNKEEIPFTKCLQEGILTPSENGSRSGAIKGVEYGTEIPYFKIFSMLRADEANVHFHSFYLKILNAGQRVTIRPFGSPAPNLGFIAHAKFISDKEAYALLNPQGMSAKFLLNKKVKTPMRVLRKVITVQKPQLAKHKVAKRKILF